ncbi:hypothetical protein [Microbacterium soli]|uniref:Histidine kinase n=1 Tax=Microbacterium soli TaxID=446075 RepID=A0ABP7NDX4_9MICO
MSAPTASVNRRTVLLRIGLVLAALLAVLGLADATQQLAAAGGIALAIVIVGLLLNLGVIALAVPAWRGSRRAAITVAVFGVVGSLGGLPAFFVPGVPAGAIIAAALGIVITIVIAMLILAGLGRRDS